MEKKKQVTNKSENLLHAVRCHDSPVKDMHKSAAIGEVAVLAENIIVHMQLEHMHTVAFSQCDVK